MSRDDVLLVAHRQSVYYVLYANASWDWDSGEWEKLIKPESPYTYSRAKALLIAHNKQKKLNTEYGVREISQQGREKKNISIN